ncbi:hypothetical protein PR048_013460 [Dryococelus australis]|uniref:Uncharacterized protein n=1 Tax=Dryococelus australis TaxID=614101 RepID=A0ABQ9HT19_9NEOP|nr:hypothetical protein PR048_013460 [Dryococelus australis]
MQGQQEMKTINSAVWERSECGEAKDVDAQTVGESKQILASLIQVYQPAMCSMVMKLDFFFRAIPTRTLIERKEKCVGGKKAKDRISVFIYGNIVGDFEKPSVVGKAANPRSFKDLDRDSFQYNGRNALQKQASKRLKRLTTMRTQPLNELADMLRRGRQDIDAEAVVSFDDDLSTEKGVDRAVQLIHNNPGDEADQDDDGENNDKEDESKQTVDYLKIKSYAEALCDARDLENATGLIEKAIIQKTVKQLTLMDMWQNTVST